MFEPDIAMIPLHTSPEQTLESILGATDARHLVVHLPYLYVDAVVLEQHERGVTLLLDGAGVTTVFGNAIARRIDDPARQAALLRQALAHEDQQARVSRRRLEAAEHGHAATLADIRGYAINQHHAGHLSRGRLNDFLRTFGLALFEPQQRVAFTITGSYLVDSDAPDRVRDDGHDRLAVTFDRLDAVVSGSDIYTVAIDSVTVAD
jgi:hypothetical protein